jgi:hypothetical protein
VQNQQPIALKFLCAELNQACFYRSPNLPLALWLGGAILIGVITSLIWQVLNSLGSTPQRAKTPLQPKPNNRSRPSNINDIPDWEQQDRGEWNIEEAPTETPLSDRNEQGQNSREATDFQAPSERDNGNYEVPQQPTSVKYSGSTYAYKYREAGTKKPAQPDEQVYDANYKTIEQSKRAKTTESTPDEDEEDWV